MPMQWSEFSCMLKPSPIGGVGVFATQDIAAGTHVFHHPHELRVLKVKDIPESLRCYCIYLNNDEAVCPERFDRMEIGWYINHSEQPNIARKAPIRNAHESDQSIIISDMKERVVYAIKDIKAGDELVINYNDLSEPEHLKEDYYKPRQ